MGQGSFTTTFRTYMATVAGRARSARVTGEPPAMDITRVLGTRLQLVQILSDAVRAWFPRTLDREHGGFLCDFDQNWQANGPHEKKSEFQARQTRAAAQAALFDDSFDQAYDAAEHGFRYLKDVMWDAEYGGWFYLLHRNGEPVFTEKHVHGFAYAIQACIAHHRLTGKMESLEHAVCAFEWLDKHAHDPANKGYHVWLNRDGSPLTTPPTGGNLNTPLGIPIGLKDANTTVDLLEAIADLCHVTADSASLERLTELLVILKDSMFKPSGVLFTAYTPDWKPASKVFEAGINLQTACILIKASHLVPDSLANDCVEIAKILTDTCSRELWDEGDGGYYYEGIVDVGGIAVRRRDKQWWVQAEAMRALLRLALGTGDDSKVYTTFYGRLWDHIDSNLIDHDAKGWYHSVSYRRRSRLARFGASQGRKFIDKGKSTAWKDASHEVRALIDCITMMEEAG